MLYLRSFLAVYCHGSISKASLALNLTQPAISRHVQLLEQWLGSKLFERLPRPIFETCAKEPTSMTAAGQVVGHGVDAVDLADCSRLLSLAGLEHLDRYFTMSELANIGHDARRVERLAGRLAIKEAVLKALGVGWGDGVAFTDVETVSLDSDAPGVVLHRRLSAREKELSIGRWLVSMSHTSSVAIASVIGMAS